MIILVGTLVGTCSCDLSVTFDLDSARMFSNATFEIYYPTTKICGLLQLIICSFI